MDAQFKRLSQTLGELDNKAEELDVALQNIRVEINDVLWDLRGLKKIKLKAQRKK